MSLLVTARPVVSVVTIFRDVALYLREAVDSVLAQTFEDWELLLVDDGSTDGSGELARDLCQEHGARLRYLTHPGGENRGMSASRNLGTGHARGRAVAFLDGDDAYLPHKLEHQLSLLDGHPEVGLVHGPMTLWWSWTGDPADAERDRTRSLRHPIGEVLRPPSVLRAYVRGRAGTPATCSVLLRREVLASVGGFEPRFTGMYEDQVFFHKAAAKTAFLITDVPGDLYRQHAASATSRSLASGHWRRKGRNPANLAFLEWLDDHLAAERPRDLVTRLAVRRHLAAYRHPLVPAAGEVPAAVRRAAGRLRGSL